MKRTILDDYFQERLKVFLGALYFIGLFLYFIGEALVEDATRPFQL